VENLRQAGAAVSLAPMGIPQQEFVHFFLAGFGPHWGIFFIAISLPHKLDFIN
jgi:hypothetical protein